MNTTIRRKWETELGKRYKENGDKVGIDEDYNYKEKMNR